MLSPEREAFLEYDLTRMVNNLANPEKPVVALVSRPAAQRRSGTAVPALAGDAGAPAVLRRADVMDGDIDRFGDDVDVLMLVHPQALSEKTSTRSTSSCMRGGKVLVFVDPHSEAQALRQQQQPGMPADTFSNLEKLLPGLGRRLRPGQRRRRPAGGAPGSVPERRAQQVVDYLPWLSLDRSHLAAGEVVTAELNRINLATAGALAARPGRHHHLHAADPVEHRRDGDPGRQGPAVSRSVRPAARLSSPGDKELVLAARVSGPLKSAFGDTAPAGRREAGPTHLSESTQPAQIIVVADTDLLDDRNWLSMIGQQVAVPVADNANLVANALDYLVGSDALMSLRGREVTVRPFTQVAEIRRAARRSTAPRSRSCCSGWTSCRAS